MITKPKPTIQEISEMPLMYDKTYYKWAVKRYGLMFMKWVVKNWKTASEREIQCMSRSWDAAGGK